MSNKIVNIHNKGRKIYLFCREKNGTLSIIEEKSFFPYYYQKNKGGIFTSYDGAKLSKIYCKSPGDIPKIRNNESYEADIIYKKRFLIDKIKELEETTIKYLVIDIEVLANHFPDQKEALYPISCITVYNSCSKEIKTFYLGDITKIKEEKQLLQDFINYIKVEKPDILTGWNFDNFDYTYLYNRVGSLFGSEDFATRISPISQNRHGIEEVMYPAGISIVDYRIFYKKIFKGLRSYSLDAVLQHEFKKGKQYTNVDFGKLNPEIKLRNIDDVKGMVAIEDRHNLISHYDRIRRLSKVEWEDFGWNSRIIDMLLLQEAKNQNIILPMKPQAKEKEEFEGAYREAYETGRFFDIGKYDLSGAYMYVIIDLCLDTANIIPKDKWKEITEEDSNFIKVNITNRKTEEITDTYLIKQNPCALLPSVVKKLVDEKNKLRILKKNTNPESPEYKSIEEKYEALKAIVLSAWGVMGNQYFRLYDSRIAGMITSVVRDLLHYVKNQIELKGYKVIYVDTDGIFIDTKLDLTETLNNLINLWALERFNKKVNIEFEYEGNFDSLLIIGKCHYVGNLRNLEGKIKKEIKGVEAKRISSAKYEAKFQETLIDKLLNKEAKEQVLSWVKNEIENFKNLSIFDISFPAKLSKRPEEYKNKSIHVKALLNTQKTNPNFKKQRGDNYYYCYVKSNEKVLAFDENTLIQEVDYDKMLERNIYNKCKAIFKATNWQDSMSEFIQNKNSNNTLNQFLK